MSRKTDTICPLLTPCIMLYLITMMFFFSTVYPSSAVPLDYQQFYRLLKDQHNRAKEYGDELFGNLEKKYATKPEFIALKSKLSASQFLSEKMAKYLKKATSDQLLLQIDNVFGKTPDANNVEQNLPYIAPARDFYKASLNIFSRPVCVDFLEPAEKTFIRDYYNIKLQHLICQIADAGQALSIAEPSFKGCYDYILVLPLLHCPADRPINIEIFPRWMRNEMFLKELSNSCLFCFHLPRKAMQLAKEIAIVKEEKFSPMEFYLDASTRVSSKDTATAAMSLKYSLDYVDKNDANGIVDIKFRIIDLWFNTGNYSMASGIAREIYQSWPNCPKAGQARWDYYFALSKTGNAKAILNSIDSAIKSPMCSKYRVKLLYMKWWALMQSRDNPAAIAAVEYDLLKNHPDNSLIAPVLLSRATDLMAKQDYNQAAGVLETVARRFPNSSSSKQAKKIIGKLKSLSSNINVSQN